MKPPRWQRVNEIFHDALAHSGDRDAFLAEAAGGDQELAEEVRSLLTAYDETGLIPTLSETGVDSDMPWPGSDHVVDRIAEALAGRYAIEGVLGRGGMALVLLARDKRHGRPVAIKVIRPEFVSDLGQERFLAEIRITANLNHPNILPLFDSGSADRFLYYVMPHVAGDSLRERLEREHRLAVDDAIAVASAVASALDYAHGEGVIHRDIKPENIMLRDDATFVADFGIALALEAAGETRLTGAGFPIGTPAYMSPEQIDCDTVDGRSDVYALGCVVYEMLAGEAPFAGKRAHTVMMRHLKDPVPPITTVRSGLNDAVDDVLATAMAKTAADRYSKATAFVAALEAALHPQKQAATSHTPEAKQRVRHTTPSDWQLEQEIRFCTASDGVNLAYAVSGEGPPLIKAANWLSHLEFDAQIPIWRHWWSGLSRRFRLIRYDERGSGLSDRNPASISFKDWVDDLATVIDATGIERFALLGVSKGGAIATAYAAKHPERVTHLIIHGGFHTSRSPGEKGHKVRERMELEAEMMRLGWGQKTPAFRQAFTTLFFPEATPEQAEWFNELQRISASPEMAARIFRATLNFDVRKQAARVTTPTLVLHCKGDARVRFEAGRRFASIIPGARFVPLPSQNHIPLEHEPAWLQFLDELYAFTGV